VCHGLARAAAFAAKSFGTLALRPPAKALLTSRAVRLRCDVDPPVL
jgi:hypothetical protein